MSEPFLSEIRLMSFSFAPRGWAFCNGQLLQINQNQALFSLLGTNYGGDGRTTFALPNLQGRVPVHMGGGSDVGQLGGERSHTLTIGEVAAHTHTVRASSSANGGVANPNANYLGGGNNVYHAPQNMTSLNGSTVSTVGGNQPH